MLPCPLALGLPGMPTFAEVRPAVYRDVHEFDADTWAVRWLAIAGGTGAALGLAGGVLLALLYTRRAR